MSTDPDDIYKKKFVPKNPNVKVKTYRFSDTPVFESDDVSFVEKIGKIDKTEKPIKPLKLNFNETADLTKHQRREQVLQGLFELLISHELIDVSQSLFLSVFGRAHSI